MEEILKLNLAKVLSGRFLMLKASGFAYSIMAIALANSDYGFWDNNHDE